VEEVVGRSKTNKIFDLQNAIGARNLKKSLSVLDNMINNDDPNKIIIYVITMLGRYFLIIWKILVLRAKSISNSEIANWHLKEIFFKFRNDYLQASQNYSHSEIKKVMSLLLQADIDAKSLNIKEEIILQKLIFEICLAGK
jgi:DNA polymerase III delta subunit